MYGIYSLFIEYGKPYSSNTFPRWKPASRPSNFFPRTTAVRTFVDTRFISATCKIPCLSILFPSGRILYGEIVGRMGQINDSRSIVDIKGLLPCSSTIRSFIHAPVFIWGVKMTSNPYHNFVWIVGMYE